MMSGFEKHILEYEEFKGNLISIYGWTIPRLLDSKYPDLKGKMQLVMIFCNNFVIKRLCCFYFTAILGWSWGWDWVKVEIEIEVEVDESRYTGVVLTH